jgi:CspA family cold shock protein
VGIWSSKRDKQDAAERGAGEAAPLSAADVERLRGEIAALGELAAEFGRRAAALQDLLPAPAAAAAPAPAPEDRVGLRRNTGTVKWYNAGKGFGFITPDEEGPEVFAHYSQISTAGLRELTEGQRVEYELARGTKGPQAERIRVAADRV